MDTNKKKVAFVIILMLVVRAIWYLESLKVHPAPIGQSGAALNLDALTSDNGTATSAPSTAGVPSAERAALLQLAAADKAAGDQPAIEITDPTGFINASSDFTLASLIGKKVILLDFWTYSCINCVRTIPYLNAWYQKYGGEGLEIVGIHTPEFDFEKNLANVQTAVKDYGIQYPVVLDSDQGTWNAYGNLYWPHEYLIDMAGYIVHDHIGEGDYDTTEAEIQKLLAERATILGTDAAAIATSTVDIAPSDLSDINSPETYFGAERNSFLANGIFFMNGNQTLVAPATSSIGLNKLYLGGVWNFGDQYATNLSAGATITYEYDAGDVYMVAAGAATGTVVEVLQDGQPIGAAAGSDVHDGKVVISSDRLYDLVKNPDGGGEHTLQLIVNSPGLQAYTFTFG